MYFKSTIILMLIAQTLSAQLPTSWTSRGMGGGGALFAPSINPGNSNELAIACDMTPLFQSTDQGDHWNTVPFGKISAGHASKMIYTSNPLIRYCISYPSVNGLDYVIPKKSVDGGLTWANLPGNPDSTSAVFFLDADYYLPDRIVMGYYNTTYYSMDGGNTFQQVHTATNPGAGEHITDVLWNGNIIYIGMIDGVLQSTNNGNSFSMLSSTGIPSGDKILSFTSGKESNNIRFYALCADAADVYTGIAYGSNYNGIPKAIYQMDNASGVWNLLTAINNTTFPSQFPVILSMAKNDIDTLYAGGGTTNGSGPCVFRHTSSGWTGLFNTGLNQNIFTGWCGDGGDKNWGWAESLFGLRVNPLNSQHILITDWGFAHLSTNGGTSWKQVYTGNSGQHPMGSSTPQYAWYIGNGMENTSCWHVLWSDSTRLFAGYSDISGKVSDDKGNRWKRFPGISENSIYFTLKAPDGKIYAAASSVHDLYQSTYLQDAKIDGGNGKIYYSTDNGNTFQTLSNLGVNKPVIWLAIDPTQSNRMYAAVVHSTLGGIYKTENLNLGTSATWTKMTDPPRTEGHAFNIHVLNNGDLVASYSGRRSGGGSFTASSGVFYSTDHGVSWSDRSDAGMQYWTKDVIIDPNDASQSTWYAAVFSGWGGPFANNNGGGLYKSVNKGLSWMKISNEYRVNSLTVDPANGNRAYLTTETAGLLYSQNFTASSPTFTKVDNYPFRQPLRVFFNPYKPSEIWVSSFGNGLYSSTPGTSTAIHDLTETADAFLYPSPTTDKVRLQLPSGCEAATITIYSGMGNKVMQQVCSSNTTLDLSMLTAGIYLVDINGKEIHTTLKLLVQH